MAQLLDIMDYVSNSVMMPFIALLSTILIGWVMTPDYVIDEMQRNGETFRRKWRYYQLSCAGAFRARELQLWQWLLSKDGVRGGWRRPA